MARSSTAESVPVPDDPPRPYQDTLWRRARSFAASTFFEGLSAAGRFHPAASPKRHGVEVEHDLIYGDDARWHQLDIYKPVHRPGPWPVVFYVHGGAFHLLSKDTHWLMGLVFARYGYLVVNISYRLAPKHPYPAAIEDTCAAYRWLASRIEKLGGDPTRVAVAGESAGGNLITSLTLAACQRRSEPYAKAVFDTGLVPRAALPFCAMLEVSRPERFAERRKRGAEGRERGAEGRDKRRDKRRLPFWVDGMIRDASASYLHGHPSAPGPATELANPLRVFEQQGAMFERSLPPFFAAVGTRDPLLDDTRRLEKALATLNVPCEARYYPGGIHAFHAMVWDPAARRCWRDALAFLDRAMRT
ncbi:MAG: alpha/beta hydrolase [Deltaproteobacteria bacterium]|nr:alpha/beta hydrolase [Deltaproteobacteria bacterium]